MQEMTVEELLNKLDSGELTLEDIDAMYQNGEISEETYNELNAALEEITSQTNTEDPNTVPAPENEPTIDELLNGVDQGNLSLDDVEAMYNNGELSEETYNEFTKAIDEINNQQAAEEEAQQDDQAQQESDGVVNEILAGLDSGEIAPEDLDAMLQNGDITEDEYNIIMNEIQGGEDPAQEEPQPEPQPIENPYSTVHLFDKFRELQKYIKIYLDAFQDIDLDQITELQHKLVSKVYLDLKDLSNNLNFYFKNQYQMNDYKKNLYSYLLFNKGFSENIIKFRRILQLQKEVLYEPKDDKKDKKKNKK